MALQVTSSTLMKSPDKLLDKGANYFKERTNARILRTSDKRKSAAELLEASKAQYVKSSYVLGHKQEFAHAGNTEFHNNSEKLHSRCTKENDIERSGSLQKDYRRDRKHRYTIGACENIPRPGRSISVEGASKVCDGYLALINKCDITNSLSEPSQVSKVIDPTPGEAPTAMDGFRKNKGNGKLMSMHLSHNRCRQLISASAVETPGGKDAASLHSSMDLSDGLHRQKKAVHRSQSDISSRHSRSSADFSDLSSRISRTSADLERFFNEMGLDKTVIDPMLRKQSQSFSDLDFLDSLSLDSPDARSICSGMCKSEKTGHSESGGAEKPAQGTSIVERNARIIKWLCNVKKARSFASSTDTCDPV